ncbi:peptidoglycan DD-metalloendopeptidase family protein [Arenimonas sp.]|jgi:lipoprotein NlpD|uniref:peptidoglycan DD-metalloendopeptidase family protein n=1 Tax=Arenimonas sp. TaxID=1872635 RepID=UPI0037BF6706
MTLIVKRSVTAILVIVLAGCQSGYQTTQNRQRTSTKPAKPALQAPPKSQESGTVIVQAGDTVFGIAFRAGLNYRDVAAWNGIEEPYTIQVGQKLRLSPPATTRASKPSKNAPALPNPNMGLSKTIPVGEPVPVKPVTPVLSNIAWQWPAKGEIIGRFIAGDKTQQGINIAGKNGQDITAAADGTVVYSGAGLIGYGELLIIKHSNEWISAYAHNSKRLVSEGVKVKAGQHIAEMGQTGSVRTMLHFEIRRNGKPVDPLLYLPKP